MSMEVCGRCRGEGQCWDDRNGRWGYCPECGGDGYVDEYQEDEWYDDEEVEYIYIDDDFVFPKPDFNICHPRYITDPNWVYVDMLPNRIRVPELHGKRGK